MLNKSVYGRLSRAALIAALALSGCDDDGGATTADAGGMAGAGGEPMGGEPIGGEPMGGGGFVIVDDGAFAVLSPAPNSVIAGALHIQAEIFDPAVETLIAAVDEIEVEIAAVTPTVTLSMPVADLPAGALEIELRALDAEGAELERRTLPIVAEPEPPTEAMVDGSGAALATPEGVVVLIPPGAVTSPTGLRVQDRPIEPLPQALRDSALVPLAAIDLLPMEGGPDPDFALERPADILFPQPAMARQQMGASDQVGPSSLAAPAAPSST